MFSGLSRRIGALEREIRPKKLNYMGALHAAARLEKIDRTPRQERQLRRYHDYLKSFPFWDRIQEKTRQWWEERCSTD